MAIRVLKASDSIITRDVVPRIECIFAITVQLKVGFVRSISGTNTLDRKLMKLRVTFTLV